MAEPARGRYPVEALANTILDYGESCGKAIGPMKLQKLMYLVHGYYLALTGIPLVDEFFEAWQYGPVVPTIYHDFRQFGGGEIKRGCRATRLISGPKLGDRRFEEPRVPADDEAAKQVLEFVFEKYGDKTATYLSDLTHKVGSPWHQVKVREPHMRNADIPNELIKGYYTQFV